MKICLENSCNLAWYNGEINRSETVPNLSANHQVPDEFQATLDNKSRLSEPGGIADTNSLSQSLDLTYLGICGISNLEGGPTLVLRLQGVH